VGSWERGTQHQEHLLQCSVCEPGKYFTSQVTFFSTPPIKLKLGLLQIRGRLLIATRLDQSKMSSQSTVGVLGFAMPFYQPEQIGNKNVGPKPFRSPKLALFDFSLSNFAVQGHILSTFGDALISASPAVLAQNVILQKCFSHPSLVIYLFSTPPIKLKLEQQIGGNYQ